MSEIKQVIVVRSDLNMRRGKEAAQVAHASMKWIADKLNLNKQPDGFRNVYLNRVERAWIDGPFAKIVVSVSSLEELMDIAFKAKDAELDVKVIIDAGRTEFHREPTTTCIAIGPDEAEKIDKITGHLKLR